MREKFLNIFTFFFAGIFCAALALSATSANSQSNNFRVKSHPQFNQKFSGSAFVLDGDSLRVGKKEVRLFGIDAPEYSQTCFDSKKKEYACGQISRDFLISLAGGKKVECLYAQKDKYDRYLSKCFVVDADKNSPNNLSINEELVKNGMAVIYFFGEADEKMEKLEEGAKASKIGVWRGAFQLPKDYRKSHPRQ